MSLGLAHYYTSPMPQNRELIDNPRSQHIRHVAELSDRRYRKRYGRFLVEGPQSVREAVACVPHCLSDIYAEVHSSGSLQPVSTVVAQILNQAMEQAPDTYVHYVSKRAIQAISKDAQGIVAVGKLSPIATSIDMLEADMDSLSPGSAETFNVAALWQVRDPGNAGTIIRTADAAGVQALLLVDDCVDPYNPKVVRSTAGSIFHIPVIQVSTQGFLSWAHERKLPIVAADVYGTAERPPVDLRTFVQQRKEASTDQQVILFGNEARGLPEEILKQVDQIVSIPIFGKAESLNLATSAAVMLYTLSMSSRLERM